MNRLRIPSLFSFLIACCMLTVLSADTPSVIEQLANKGNTYNMYTSALGVSETGVVTIPSRYRWSVETGTGGIDHNGRPLPDGRIQLRLYDPDHNFSCFMAQMDLTTAAKLHHELGAMLVKKLQNPTYMYQPQLYRPDQIPTKRIIGIDLKGNAILETVKPAKK